MKRVPLLLLLALLMLLALATSCAPASSPAQSHPAAPAQPSAPAQAAATQAPAATQAAPAAVTQVPAPTQALPRSTEAGSLPPLPTNALEPTQAVQVEQRLVELEWPASLRLGNSDVLRLSLVPSQDGYNAQVEFPEHSLQTKPIPVRRPPGYSLAASARLDGVNFTISPGGDQVRQVPPEETITWRWSITPRQSGQQRLAIHLLLRWEPEAGNTQPARESLAFDRGIDVRVSSFLGMAPSEAGAAGIFGLLLGAALALVALIRRPARVERPRPVSPGGIETVQPNPAVRIETPTGMALAQEESGLLQSLFDRQQRVVIENEFLSGYSGARTFLVRPIHADGLADAPTIVKLGSLASIQQEYTSYDTYVKDRLPPITARIQRPPVALRGGKRAAVQYTFIAEPGHPPVSLGDALRAHPDPELLLRLFETFGPYWWMQKRPATFRLEQEYDGLLPPHYALAPVSRSADPVITLSQESDPHALHLAVGEIVRVGSFDRWEPRPGEELAVSLYGKPQNGSPALRLRVQGGRPAPGACYQVTATRASLLWQWTAGMERCGLPDPLEHLDAHFQETVSGSRSVIHGDLNLQNVLAGPGNLIWLIDFARTREGHPLFDFAHLEAELIAHLLSAQAGSPRAYLDLWRSERDPLLGALHTIAGRCLFDPARPREYHLALWAACLGALKYPTITPLGRHCLYLTAASLETRLAS